MIVIDTPSLRDADTSKNFFDPTISYQNLGTLVPKQNIDYNDNSVKIDFSDQMKMLTLNQAVLCLSQCLSYILEE